MYNFILNNGVQIPAIGLGTFPMKGDELVSAVNSAADIGYRAFDTASAYKNTEELGKALKQKFRNREDYFVTTKLSNSQQRKLDVREALTTSLKYLNLEYVDLYLMHWPNPDTYLECYNQMEKVYKEGLVRAIGVCNFHEHHLERLMKNSEIVPSINQFELHPMLTQKPLVKYCKAHGIQVTAYTPFARMSSELINNEQLVKIANKYKKDTTQIILRWNYQNQIISIPKSSNYERQKSNFFIYDFEISDTDIKLIDDINRNFRVRHDPDNCNFECL